MEMTLYKCPLLETDFIETFIPTVARQGKFLKCVRNNEITDIFGKRKTYVTVDYCFYDGRGSLWQCDYVVNSNSVMFRLHKSYCSTFASERDVIRIGFIRYLVKNTRCFYESSDKCDPKKDLCESEYVFRFFASGNGEEQKMTGDQRCLNRESLYSVF